MLETTNRMYGSLMTYFSMTMTRRWNNNYSATQNKKWNHENSQCYK